ncbi:MAG TPA: very short patch repair endonuclease [Acidobacteriaceae bacterium]|nr:very short patch repair endonuclease [Acidobacteriaceae bacterium]
MQSVGTKNTGPELVVRRLLYGMGRRYRLHGRGLPGRPDIVLPGKKKAIFVHGCFWHAHRCSKGRCPKSRLDYWEPKLNATRLRDRRTVRKLKSLGWSVLTIWQCELTDLGSLTKKLLLFLD